MKKKKYGWLRRCFSLMCVLVLISMIVLQSVPVTYASSEPDAFTSEPEDNSQTISTAEIPTGDDTQPGNQLVDDIFSEENSETSPEIPTDDNSEMLSNSPVEGNQDETSENISGTQEGEISDVFQNPSSEPEQETSSEITDDQQDELTSGENATKENPDSEQSDSESNINPQQENEDIWKDSIATAALTGDYAKDITAIARTQLGVQENKDNFITAEDGTIHCYSRYGQWAGDAYEEWSAAFVNFCVHYANIPQQYLPKSEKVSQWIQQLEAMSLHIEKEGYTPKEGDLVFFLTNEHAEGNSQIQTDTPAHTGIVTAADEQYLYTIEGNCGGMVQEEKYGLASDNIYGYLDMDQVKKLAGVLQEEPADPTKPETPADPEESKDSEQNGNEENNEENNDTQDDKSKDQPEVLEWKNDDVTITAEALTEDAIMDGTTLNVIPVEKDNNETAFQYSEVEAELQKKAENEEYEIAGFLAYDIKLVNADGENYEPDGRVKISMKYNEPAVPELKEQDNSDKELDVTVMHLEEDDTGNVTEVVDLKKTDFGENLIQNIEVAENQAVTNVEFSADSFSTYAITWTNHRSSIKDVQGNSLTQQQYEQYLNAMLAFVEGTAGGNLPIKDWKRSSQHVNVELDLSESASENSTINGNWWTTVSALSTDITDAANVWDGSRNETHNYTDYLPNRTVTVYKQTLYDSATWKNYSSNDNEGSMYRFQGTFDIGEDNPNECTYTIQQVTGNDRLYINDDMWVFIYPQGTSITSENYMDYLAFWTGTRNQTAPVKYFNDRRGTFATKAGEAGNLRDLTKLTDGWNMVSVTDNAGAIIQSVYNKETGNHATKYVIDVFADDYSNGGGIYRLTVNKKNQPKTRVELKKTDADGKLPLSGAEFAVDDSTNSVHYTAVSGEDGMVIFNLLKNKTYTLTETKAPDGYEKSTDKWTITINENGGYTITKQDNGEEMKRTEEDIYYVPNISCTTSVDVTKIWKDGNNLNNTRPDSIKMTLQYRTKNPDSEWQNYQAKNVENPFVLKEESENQISQSQEKSNIWKKTITGLPLKIDGHEVEYRVVEDTVNGYDMEQTDFVTVTNKVRWKIIKQDSVPDSNGNYQRLSGAEFALSKEESSSETSDFSRQEVAKGISGSGNSLGVIEWTPVQGVTMDELNGSYILTETAAPKGYIRSTEEWTLEFVDGILTKINNREIDPDEQNEITCFLSNKKLEKLPDTGGTGTFLFTISGAIIMTGALLLYINKRKEEETA